MPASGKSTYVKQAWHIGPPQVVSTDNIIEEIAAEYGYTYDEIFSDVIKFAEKVFWDDIEAAIDEGFDIAVDRTNMSVKSRQKFFNALKQHRYEFHAVVFRTPEETEWRNRLAGRSGKTIPEHVLTSMHNNFEMPTIAEGFTSVVEVVAVNGTFDHVTENA